MNGDRGRTLGGLLFTAAFLAALGAWLMFPKGGQNTKPPPDDAGASRDAAFPAFESRGGDRENGEDTGGPAHAPEPDPYDDPDHAIAAVAAFEDWVTAYLATTDVSVRAGLIPEGVRLAAARRAALFTLIAANPKFALETTLPWAERAVLPASVVAQLEERVSGVGSYNALAARPPEGQPTEGFRAVYREAIVNGRTYEAFVHGRRSQLMTQATIALHGIAIDGRLAVRESPVRLLEPDEPIPPDKRVDEICLISGNAAGPGMQETGQSVIAADLGDRIVYLCHADHISLVENGMLAREGGEATVAGPTPAAVPEYTTGAKSVLLIRVRFADQAAAFEPQTATAAQSMFAEAGAFLGENSYGKLTIEPTVTPVYVLPQSAAWYQANDSSGYALNVLQAARAVAANPGHVAGNEGKPAFDYAGFDFEVVRYTGGPGGFSGQAYVGMRGCWLKTNSAGVLAHELGHNLGLWHANAWAPTTPATVVGPGHNIEYGDDLDSMGPAMAGAYHFNTYEKHRLTWLPPEAVQVVASSGVYEVHAHDVQADVDPARKLALFVRRDADRDYWFEYRRHPGWDGNAWLLNGLGVRWDPWQEGNGGSQVLDTTPYSPEGRSDGTILFGRTFSDPVGDIHVTPLGPSDGQDSAMSVALEIGPFPGNRSPRATLHASTFAAAVGQAVSFSVQASDPDDDPLAYYWDFGDRSIGANAAATTKSWSQSGDHRVRVVVSDRKGGTASASLVVRIGEASGAVLAGRVVDLNGDPIPDVHVDNGRSPGDAAYRHAWSDSDGSFALTGLPDGTWTVRATRAGWATTPLTFANPVATPRADEPIDFLGHFVGYVISGRVRYADGTPVAHALVSNGVTTEPTDQDGNYLFGGQASGSYQLTASIGESVFESETVDVAFGDVVAPTIIEATHTVSGAVTGAVDGWVTVTDGWRSTDVQASSNDPNAAVPFALDGVPAGSWHVRATQSNASFVPDGWVNPLVLTDDVAGLRFVRSGAMTFGISGRVTDLGRGVANVAVAAGTNTTTTDSRGRYYLSGLAAGSHLVTISAPGLNFAPVGRAVTITDGDITAQDFGSTRINQPPVILAAAHAIPPFDRATIPLAIEADDDDGAEFLRYHWSVVDAAPGSVSFSRSGTHGAAETVATFSEGGEHHLRATVVDGQGGSVSSTVRVTVLPAPVALTIHSGTVVVPIGSSHQFPLSGIDQFGAPMKITSGAAWSVSGGGAIGSDGTLEATVPGEDFEVVARVGGKTARASFSVGYPPGPGSGVTREVWTRVPGSLVADLTNWPTFPHQPDFASVLAGALEVTAGSDAMHGRRLRGYFVPPVTGDYLFQLAAADAGELWLSPGVVPEQAQRIAWVDQATGFREWSNAAGRRSAPVSLREGQPIYLEVLHKDSSAGGHLSVGVQAPGGVFERPIPGHRLLPWGSAAFAPPEIIVPAHATPARVAPGQSVTLAVAASSAAGAGSLSFHWHVAGSAPGPVAFSANGSNVAQATTAHLSGAGLYPLRVTVTDDAGQSAHSDVQVVVTETMRVWRARYFPAKELADAAQEATRWGEEADPDGDGLNNLLEYAFGLDPLTSGREGTPRPTVVTVNGVDYLAITFRRNVAATGLSMVPEVSSDLKTWNAGLLPVGNVDGETVTYRDLVPLQSTQRRFVRVRVSTP